MIVRRKVVREAETPYLLMKVGLEKKENLVHQNKVERDSTVTSVLAKLSWKMKLKTNSEKVVLQ